MMQIKYKEFFSNCFSFAFQVYTPSSLVALAVKEVAKVYRFYDQDAFSFVRNIDYHPLTVTDLAPPELFVRDDSGINRMEEEKREKLLTSARRFLRKRRRAINAIFDTIAKMIVNFRNKKEVDELDLKKLRVKTSNYRGMMDLLESVGIEVELEDMLEKMIGHIQQFRFRAKLLNLVVNQSYLGYGEKVEDVESAGDCQAEGMKIEDTNNEHNKNSGVEKVGGGLVGNASDNLEEVNEEKTEKKIGKTDLVVRDEAESAGDGVRKVGGGALDAAAAGHQEEVDEENNENDIEVTNLADGCYVKFAGYYPGDRLKIEEENYNHSRNNGIDGVCGGVNADTADRHEKVKEERIEEGIEKTDLAVRHKVESAGDRVIREGRAYIYDYQEKVAEERIEDGLEKTDLAVGKIVGSAEYVGIRKDGYLIDDHQGKVKEEKADKEIEKTDLAVGGDNEPEGNREIKEVGDSVAVDQKGVNEERIDKEIKQADLAVGHDIESAGDCLGDGVKHEAIESDNDRERDLSEIKVMIEKEGAELAFGNKGYPSGDVLKIGDMIGDCDRVGQEQLLLGSTIDNEGELDKERKSVGKKEADSTKGDERFNIGDEEEDHFVLYGMVRCS